MTSAPLLSSPFVTVLAGDLMHREGKLRATGSEEIRRRVANRCSVGKADAPVR